MSLEDETTGNEPIEHRHESGGISAYQLWQLQKQKRALREEYFAHWQETSKLTGTGRPVDAIIAPVANFASIGHGKNK